VGKRKRAWLSCAKIYQSELWYYGL